METMTLRVVGEDGGWRVIYIDGNGDICFISAKRFLTFAAAKQALLDFSFTAQDLLADNDNEER